MPAAEIVRQGGARKLRTVRLSDGRTMHVYVVPKTGAPTTRKRGK